MRLDSLVEYDESLAAAASPVFAVGDDGSGLDAAPESLRKLADFNNFQGEVGAVLANEDGVLFGAGDGGDPFAAAVLAERFRTGDFCFPNGADEARLLAWLLGGYGFYRYRKPKNAAARLIAPQGADIEKVKRRAAAVGTARDLVNTPAGDMGPDALEAAIRTVAEVHGAQVDVTTGDALLAKNFPMIHAVGRASAVPPRLVDLTWGRADAPKVTLVGKGVCFDSGGLDIKGASGMLLMKKDMGGAANALALAQMIMAKKLDIRLRLLTPAVENAISGNAFRPGDVLPSRQGLTVEIGNTDAEGRLVLADAMTYGGEDRPDIMVTLATLTGAARVALGPDLPPFYTDDDALADDVAAAAAAEHDPVWRMPLWAPYEQMLSSPIADTNNITNSGFAGSVTAALFLKKFAPKSTSWAHFDIYAWRPKAAPGRPVGGEAQAIRALAAVFERRFDANA